MKLLGIGYFLAIWLVVLSHNLTTVLAQASDATITLAHTLNSVSKGESFETYLLLDAGNFKISAIDIRVRYDKNKLELKQGFSGGNSSNLISLGLTPANFDGETLEYAAIAKSGKSFSGQITLGKIQFIAKDNNINPASATHIVSAQISSSQKSGYLTYNAIQALAQFITSPKSGQNQTSPSSYSAYSSSAYIISEDLADLEDPTKKRPFIKNDSPTSLLTNYSFKDATPGLKRIYVRFFSSNPSVPPVTSFADISYLPNPSLKSISCYRPLTGIGIEVKVISTNFNAHNPQGAGFVKVNGKDTKLISWVSSGNSSTIVAKADDNYEGVIQVELQNDEQKKLSGSCQIDTNTLEVVIKTQCRPVNSWADSEVSLTLYDKNLESPVFQQKIALDQQGRPVNLDLKLIPGKNYVFLIKGPKTLASKVEFVAGEGTTSLEVILPIGNIAPLSRPDNKINSIDAAELKRQWSLVNDVSRTADFNQDGRVNSLDWSCMVQNVNKIDEVF